MGMAQSIAWRHIRRLPPGADVDEILSVAMEGLCHAAAKWIDYCQARGFCPWSPDDPDRPEAHFGGYAVKTVHGRILDWCRHQDHVPRQVRGRLKQLAAAQETGARTEAELAAATGPVLLTRPSCRTASAAPPAARTGRSASSAGGTGAAGDEVTVLQAVAPTTLRSRSAASVSNCHVRPPGPSCPLPGDRAFCCPLRPIDPGKSPSRDPDFSYL